jgi:hypothetical protein
MKSISLYNRLSPNHASNFYRMCRVWNIPIKNNPSYRPFKGHSKTIKYMIIGKCMHVVKIEVTFEELSMKKLRISDWIILPHLVVRHVHQSKPP